MATPPTVEVCLHQQNRTEFTYTHRQTNSSQHHRSHHALCSRVLVDEGASTNAVYLLRQCFKTPTGDIKPH